MIVLILIIIISHPHQRLPLVDHLATGEAKTHHRLAVSVCVSLCVSVCGRSCLSSMPHVLCVGWRRGWWWGGWSGREACTHINILRAMGVILGIFIFCW